MFEDPELRYPYDRLREAGHEVVLVGLEAGRGSPESGAASTSPSSGPPAT
jgi:putative intracellular protease/amidase